MGVAKAATVLVVDDDQILLRAYARAAGTKHRVLVTSSPDEARSIVRTEHPDVAIVDLRLCSDSGIALVRDLKATRADMVVVLVSAYLSTSVTVAAIKAGAEDVIPKPTTLSEILGRIGHGSDEPDLSRVPTLREVQWEHIQRVLDETRGNVSVAARILGIERNTLKKWIRSHAPREST